MIYDNNFQSHLVFCKVVKNVMMCHFDIGCHININCDVVVARSYVDVYNHHYHHTHNT